MKKIFLSLLAVLLLSCSSDDVLNENQNSNVIFSGYKITSLSVYDDGITPDNMSILVGNIVNNKFISETIEYYTDNISQGNPEIRKEYFYSNNLLTKIVFNNDIKELYYDTEQKLVGLTWNISGSSYNYYRFVHVSQSLVYFERVSLPYNDSNTQVISRKIIEFNDSNDVTKAGFDNNLDMVLDSYFEYTYSNGNIIQSKDQNGVIKDYNYSNVVNNNYILEINSFGKKTLNIFNSEAYAYNLPTINKLSRFLNTETHALSSYEILSNNYFTKEIKIEHLPSYNLLNTKTTEFFFE